MAGREKRADENSADGRRHHRRGAQARRMAAHKDCHLCFSSSPFVWCIGGGVERIE